MKGAGYSGTCWVEWGCFARNSSSPELPAVAAAEGAASPLGTKSTSKGRV